MPIICGVLQLKLQDQTHLWGVPGCANHLWGPPIEITGSNTSVRCVFQSSVGEITGQTHLWGVPGCANHLWGPPIKITGSNTSVRCTRVCQSSVGSSNEITGSNISVGCTRVCQSSVGSSNQNYRLKHICGVYQGVPIIYGVLQLKLQAQTHLWGVPGCANHLWGPPIEITGSNISVGVPGCANHLWGPPIEITGSNTSVGCTRVCQSSVGSSNQNYRLKHICEVYQGVPIICGILQ